MLRRAPSASLLDLRKRVPFEQLCQCGGGGSFPRDPYTALRRRPRESDAAMRAFAVGSALKRPGEVPASPSFPCQIHVGGGTQRQNNKGQARRHSATRIVRSRVQHLRGCIARLGTDAGAPFVYTQYVDVIGTRGTYICRIRYLGQQAVRNPLVPLVVDLSLAPVLDACPPKPELTIAITLQP